MADSNTVFVKEELDCASREPTHTTHGSDARLNNNVGESNAVRRRRRPRRVVVYYFDSDAESDDQPDAPVNGIVPSSASKRESSGKGLGPNDSTTLELEKMECPGLEELEQYSNGNNSDARLNTTATGEAATGAAMTAARSCCCCCNGQARKPVSVNNPRIGSPTPIGFFAFGMTTLLYNVHNAKICQLNTATMGMVMMFGGLTQFLCGFFELINMNTLGCTISTTYGAFWMATAVLFIEPVNAYVAMSDHTYTGGFFLLWFFFAGTLFASAFRSPFMCMALFFLVPVNFLLQSIGYFADSTTVAKVAGYEGIVVGALATYLGMAFTLRDVYGRSLLPILFQKNLRYVEW